ncbi:hypothetical protein [Isoptericola croceus]|uniref:hypothetical protein n=1 Tax=Isoptericola croceus TaxID=3031406 RepID=UPI0023F73737|nr:hypothetical protein [Isoptericola croceus]
MNAPTTLTAPLDSLEVDTRATSVAEAWAAGQVSDFDVRAAMADLVYRSGITASLARQVASYRPHLADELGARTLEFLVRRVYADDGLDLTRIADACSLSGWARQLGRTYATRQLRDMCAAHSESRTAGPLDADLPTAVDPGSDPAGTVLDADTEDLLARLDAVRESSRTPGRDEMVAAERGRALRVALGLPRLVAPDRLAEAARLRRACAENPGAAWRALTERHYGADDALAALWDDFDVEDAATLRGYVGTDTDMAYEAANLLVAEILAVPERPAKRLEARLLSAVRCASRQVGFADSAQRLTLSWLAVARTLVRSDDRRTSDEAKAVLVLQRARAAEQFDQVLADHLSAFESSALGRDERTVHVTLTNLLAELGEEAP